MNVKQIYNGNWVVKDNDGETLLPVINGEVEFEFGFPTQAEAEAFLNRIKQ